MTKNQLDYLGLEETKRNNIAQLEEQKRHAQATEGETHRNNLVIEQQGKDRNAEAKRDNIARLKETKKHNRRTEKQAATDTKVKALTSVRTSRIGAAATTATGFAKSEATRYSADVKATSDALKRANDRLIASRNNRTAVKIQDSKNATSELLKQMDKLMNDANLSQRDRESLRKMYTQIKTNNDKLSVEATQAELNRQAKLLTSVGGWIATLGSSTSKKGKQTAKTATNKSIEQMKRGGTTEYKPGVYKDITGASPASTSGKSSDRHKKTTRIRIKAKKVTAKDVQNRNKKAAKKATFTKNPLSKVRQYTQTSKGKTKYKKG